MKKHILLSAILLAGLSAYAQKTDTTSLEEIDIEDLVGVDINKGVQKNHLSQVSRQDISTATKLSERLEDIPAIAEVITAEQINNRGYRHLGDVLNDIANNHQDRTNWGIGEPTNQNVGFGFRFDTGQNILLLFNGQRLNAFLPGNRFGGEEYLLDNIERIEVVRGSGSALYGSNAFTAIVNIISKSSLHDTQKSRSSATLLSNPSAGGIAASAATEWQHSPQTYFSAAARYSTEKGQNILVENGLYGNQKVRDGVFHTADAELFFQHKGFRTYSKLSNQRRNTFTGFNGVSPSSDKTLDLSMFAYALGADYTHKITPKLELKAKVGTHQDNWTEVARIPIFKVNATGDSLLRDADGNTILDSVSVIRNGEAIRTPFVTDGQGGTSRSVDGEIQLTYNYYRASNLIVGTSLNHDRVVDAYRPTEIQLAPTFAFVPYQTFKDDANNWLFDTKATRTNLGAYAQIDFELGTRWFLNVGARADVFRGTGLLDKNLQAFSPRAGIVYINRKTGNFKLMYGSAFRAPNGFETLSSVTILGNPQNKPEDIHMYQFQWSKNLSKKLRIELGGWYSEIQDRLLTDANITEAQKIAGYVGQFINEQNKKSYSQGIDGSIVFKAEKIDARLNFTQMLGVSDDIRYIPSRMLNLNVSSPVSSWLKVNVGANYRGGFTKNDSDKRAVVKDYVMLNTNLLATPWAKLPLTFRLGSRNTLNSKIQYPSSSLDFVNHFPARRIEILLGVQYRL